LVDPRRADPSGAFAYLRSGVVDRLVTAQSLLPREIRLLVVEGYRLPAVQECHFREHYEQLRRARPRWPPATLYERTGRRVPAAPRGGGDGSAGAASGPVPACGGCGRGPDPVHR